MNFIWRRKLSIKRWKYAATHESFFCLILYIVIGRWSNHDKPLSRQSSLSIKSRIKRLLNCYFQCCLGISPVILDIIISVSAKLNWTPGTFTSTGRETSLVIFLLLLSHSIRRGRTWSKMNQVLSETYGILCKTKHTTSYCNSVNTTYICKL